ncbi:mediator of RNA polymerase II transcription subunit 1-like isoform X1 [Takifugu rubripes]|uniref:Mediator of RNA polymerase II transcription subunit 1 n=2 Tax=Takifugu rubripes TaxID=31033 RepID=H2UB71_TAKRU|nr:mediator of RNA polymerase II transcription subunit 1-like isoform X1 [Takifugu rubripes]
MNANLILENLHLKFANKTWNETFNLVRTCTEKPMEWSKPLCSALERLQEVLNASSTDLIRHHLQRMARQQGMDFHISEATCCLTADLFRLEVALLPCGGVENVKLTPHAGFPIHCESLLQLLRAENFSEFSAKLTDLLSQYNIPGDKETKLRLFESLQLLSQDLQCMSSLPRVQLDSEAQIQLINDGLMGCLKAANADHPLTIQFYSVPAPGSNASDLFVQGAQVTIGASDAMHKLQLASALIEPAVTEDQRTPVFLPLSEVPHQSLPGCFLLRLQPPMPLILSFITKISSITGVLPDVDLQGEPLPKVLTSGYAKSHKEDEKDAVFSEGFILPGAAWDVPAQRAAVVDHIPFTHPSHVPALLEILRHQSAINALLRSCVAKAAAEYPVSDLYELLPESETSFSVTFQRRDADSLAVLLVNITDSRQISCKLFGAGTRDPSLVEMLSSVLTRSMSVPLTLMALHSQR